MPTLKPLYILATLAYCAAIFYVSSMPKPPAPEVTFPGADKIAHFLIYGGLATILSFGLRLSNESIDLKFLFLAPILIASIYGVSDEIHQLFVPNRSFELLDILADAAGATFIQTILCAVVWKKSSDT